MIIVLTLLTLPHTWTIKSYTPKEISFVVGDKPVTIAGVKTVTCEIQTNTNTVFAKETCKSVNDKLEESRHEG
jgi:hypothetical protein